MIEHERMQIGEGESFTLVRFSQPRIRNFLDAEDMGRELGALVEAETVPRFAVDLSGVESLGSAALGKLISMFGRVRARQGAIVFFGLTPGLSDVFRTCHLDKIFEIRAGLDEVLAYWSRRNN
jgi:anti-anti-sigma factor